MDARPRHGSLPLQHAAPKTVRSKQRGSSFELRQINCLTRQCMRAIAQKLDATIRHKRVANCWRCAIPARVRAIVGHEDRGREGRALWIDVISPARTRPVSRSEENTSELQSLMRKSYAVFSLN